MTNKNKSEATDLDFSERPVPPEGRMPKINLMKAEYKPWRHLYKFWRYLSKINNNMRNQYA